MSTIDDRPAADGRTPSGAPQSGAPLSGVTASGVTASGAPRSGPPWSALPKTGLATFALAMTYLASATTPWNGAKFGVRPGDFFLLLALLAFGLSDLGRAWPRLPAWAWQFAGIIVLVTAAHELLPTDPRYLAQRLVINGTIPVPGGIELQTNLVGGIKFLVPIIGLPLMYGFAYLHDRRALFRAAYAFAIGSAISGFVGISDVLGLTRLSLQFTGLPAINGRAPGLSIHPNFLAMTCVLSLPIMLWQLLSPRLSSRVLALFFLAALALGLYASGSRGGAAVGPGAVLLSFAVMPRYRPVLPTVALLMGGLASLVFVLKPSVGTAILHAVRLSGDTGSASGSDEARSIVGHQGLRDFLHSPIDGVGMQVAEEAHNVYLQALASGGVLLATGYVIFVVSGLLKVYRQMKFDELAYPLFVSAVAGAIFVIVQSALIDRVAYVPLAIVAALPVGRAADPDQAVDASPETVERAAPG